MRRRLLGTSTIDISLIATITCDSATYNGQNQTAQNIVVVVDGNTLINGTDYQVSGNNGGTDVGTYTFTITGTGKYKGSKQGSFTINKVTPTVIAPTAKVLTYNGSAQALVNAGSTNYGTLQYSSDNSTWSTTVPSATNYGRYTVYYRVVGNSNINDVASKSVACSISEKKVTATVTLSQTSYTYSGNACQPTVTVKDGNVTIPSSEYSVTYSNNVNAGTATVTVYDNTGGNYDVTGRATFTINKATPTYTAPTAKSNLTYSGSAQALLNAGSTSHGTIQYSSNNSSWSTTVPTGTNATSYTSYWRLVGDSNHNDISSTSISTTIGKASQNAPTATGVSVSYGNTATATASGGGGQGSIEWSNGNTLSGNVGSKKTKARWSGNSNYNASAWSNEVTLAITKINPSITAPTAKTGLTYNGSSQTLYNAGSNTTAGTFSYTNGTRKDAGSQTVSWTFTPSDTTNYNSKSGSFSVTIAQATGSASVSGRSVAYSRGSQNLLSVSNNTGTMYYRVGTSGSWTTTIPTSTNCGSWTIYYYMAASTNYTARGSASSPWGSVTGSITKVTPVLSTSPTKTANWTYNGTSKALASGGAMKHSSSDSTAVAGTFTYGTAQNAGSYTATWSFTPTDTTNYNSTSGNVGTVTVAKATPTLSFSKYVTMLGTDSGTGPYINEFTFKAESNSPGTITYRSTNAAVLSINQNTGYAVTLNNTWVNEITVGITATITATSNYNSTTFTYDMYIVETNNGYRTVDLGLPTGTKWAYCNVGTNNQELIGELYLPGAGNKPYSQTGNTPQIPMGDYSIIPYSKDTAAQVLKGDWITPTISDWDELCHNCTAICKLVRINDKNVKWARVVELTSKRNSATLMIPCYDYSSNSQTFTDDDRYGYLMSSEYASESEHIYITYDGDNAVPSLYEYDSLSFSTPTPVRGIIR